MSSSCSLQRYVCGRCQTRIAYGISRHLFSSGRNQSTSIDGSKASHFDRNDESLERRQRPFRWKPLPAGKSWSAVLDAKSLGQASEILVFRESETRRTNRSSTKLPPAQLGTEVTTDALLAAIETDNEVQGQEEIDNHIRALRPDASRYSSEGYCILSKTEWEDIYSQLFGGFKLVHLSRYYTVTAGAQLEEAESSRRTNGNLLFRSKWRPIVAQVHSKKKQAVHGILNELWRITRTDEEEMMGELELTINKRCLDVLLVRGQESILNDLVSRAHIKIDVYRSSGIVKLTGSVAKCVYVAQEIEGLTKNFQETLLELSSYGPEGSADLSVNSPLSIDMNRITNTAHSVSTCNKYITVSYISPTDLEQVKRLLFILRSSPTNVQQGLMHSTLSGSEQVLCLPAGGTSSLPFKYRHNQLGRMTVARKLQRHEGRVRAQSSSQRRVGIDTKAKICEKLWPLLRSQAQSYGPKLVSRAAQLKHAGWDPDAHISRTCRYGKMLHSYHNGSNGYVDIDDFVERHRCFTFDPQSPVGSSILQKLSLSPSNLAPLVYGNVTAAPFNQAQQHLRLALSPMWDLDQIRSSFPELELHLKIDPSNEQISSATLVAILGTHSLGIACPSSQTDMHFTQTLSLYHRHPTTQSSIASLIREIEDRLAGFGQIRLPSSLRIQIPCALLGQDPEGHHAKSVEDEVMELDYCITQIEYQDVMEYDFIDSKLCLAFTDGGDIGGRAEELWLESVSNLNETSCMSDMAKQPDLNSVSSLSTAVSGDDAMNNANTSQSDKSHGKPIDEFVTASLKILDAVEEAAGQIYLKKPR